MRVLHLEALEQRRMLSVAAQLGQDALDGPLGTESSPAPTVDIDLQADSDSGASCSDNITNVRTPTYDVRVNKPGTLEIDWEDDGTVDISETVTESGVYEYAPAAPLADGTYPVVVEFTDDDATVATADNPTTIDTLGPTVVGVTPSGTVTDPVSELTINYNDAGALWEDTIVNRGNYALHSAGGDGTFDDGNEISRSARFADVAYDPDSQSAVISLHFAIGDDHFRLTLDGTSSVRDVAGNALDGDGDSTPGGDFVHTFEVTAPTLSRDIYVDDVTDPFEVGTREHPFDTFQEAIDLARDGDFIIALDGTYSGAGNRDLQLHGKAVVVQSVNPDDASVVESTVIDCQASANDHHRAFWIHQGENAETVIAGLKITGGYARDGGALYLRDVNPMIEKNLFVNNHAEYDGGAIRAHDGSNLQLLFNEFTDNIAGSDGGAVHIASYKEMWIFNNTFLHNAATDGEAGAIGVYNSSELVDLNGNEFTENVASTSGGAIRLRGGQTVQLLYNHFTDNASDTCGAVHITYYEHIGIFNSTFLRNMATNGTGGAIGVFNSLNSSAQVELVQNIFAGNSAGNDGGAIYISGGDILELLNNQFENNTASNTGGAIRTRNGKQFQLLDNDFTDNVADQRGAVNIVSYERIDVLNNTFAHNIATEGEAGAIGIYNTSLLVELSENAFTENAASSSGGAIRLRGGAEAQLHDNRFTDNTAEAYGAVHITYHERIGILNSTFLRNTATNGTGGAIGVFNSSDRVELANNVFIENIAGNDGGAFYASTGNVLQLFNNQFEDNIAGDDCGGAYVTKYDTVDVSDNVFVRNTAADRAGAIHFNNCTTCGLQDNTFVSNTAQSSGGAVEALQTDIKIIGNTIRGNSAGSGGGILLRDACEATIENNSIEKNVAHNGAGGGIRLENSRATVTQNVVAENEAHNSYGGGIHCYRAPALLEKNVVVNNVNVGSENQKARHGTALSVMDCSPWLVNNVVYSNLEHPHANSDLTQILICRGLSAPLFVSTIVWGDAGESADPWPVITPADYAQFFYCNTSEPSLAGSNGNLNTDPAFENPLEPAGPDGLFFTGDDGFQLQSGSPCIDMGHPSLLDGLPTDMGAYGVLPRSNLTEIEVDASNTNRPWLGTPANPYRYIWQSLLASSSGATVNIAPGTYAENLVIRQDHVTLSGADDQESVIDGRDRSGVLAANGVTGLEIENLTLTNGKAADGGAVRCYDSELVISDSRLITNRARWNGGAVQLRAHSEAMITGTKIIGNRTWWGGTRWEHGGGVACDGHSFVEVAGSIIAENTTRGQGGGIFLGWSGQAVVENTLIHSNSAGTDGGGVHVSGSGSAQIVNSTIYGNDAEDLGGGIRCSGSSSTTLRNSILWKDEAPAGDEVSIGAEATLDVSYTDVQGGRAAVHDELGADLTWGPSIIDADPRFADPESGDYHLRSVAGRWDADARDAAGEDTGAWVLDGEHSPCIDRGGPDTEEPFDWGAEPLPNGERINMGAYGGTPEASKSATVPHVVNVWPAPGSSVETGVPRVTLTFDLPMEPATLWSEHFALVGAGGDGHFGDGDEVEWPIEEVVWDAETQTATLVLDLGCGGFLPRDTYRLTALDALRSEAGRRLDGEYDPAGYPPSGDGWAGGSFLVTFDVPNAPPRAFADHATLEQDSPATALPALTGCDADGDAITFEINGTPWTEPGQTIPTEHGTLTAGADSAHWSYEPDPGFSGHDSFSFQTYDGFNTTGHEALSVPVQFDLLVVPQPCDLEPIDLGLNDPPANLHMGHTVTAEWTVINHGPAATALAPEAWNHWLDSLYLSADAILDPDTDELLHVEEIDVAALAANDTYQVSAEVTLPANLEWSGDYYLIVEANSNRMQWETDTANNVLAEPVVLHPYVELVRPYCGQFTDNRTHLEFVWIDIDRQHDASINLAVDNDDDPSNGTPYEWLAEGLPEDPDGAGDTHQVLLPDLTPRVDPYYVWAQIDNGSEIQHSEPVAIRVFEAAYYSDDELGDAIGGWGYETLGIEAGLLDDTVYYRVLTNYPPTQSDPLMPPLEGKGGDVYVNVGGRWQDGDGVVHGIAVNQSSDYRAPELANGDLYTEAEFGTGVVVSSRPTFIVDWVDQLSDRSSAVVAAPACLPWDYVIDGHFELGALPDYADESIQIAWSMYCGNDITDVIIPGRDTLRVVDMAPTPACLCPELVNDVGEVVLWFNRQDVDPASVNTDTFQVFDVGVDGRYGTPDDVEVPTESVVYDAQTWTATWTPASPLAARHTYAVRLADRGLDGALTFDGEDDFVDTRLNINQGATSNGITFEAWVRPESTSSGRHVVISTDDGGFDWSVLRQGGTWRVSTGEGCRSTGMSVDVGVWQHIAAVFEPEVGVTFYKNGQPALVPHLATDESDSPLAIGATPGGFHGGKHFDGTIDEVRVWNTPRTETEIRQKMYGALDGSELGLLGYWDFEEGTGQIAYDAGPLAFHAILGETLDPDDSDPTWSTLAAPVAGVRDLDGRPLDGEFSCQFPSGDGQDGGEFVARFMVGEDFPNVIAMDPAPGEVVDAATGMNRVHVTFDAPLEPATLYPLNFELMGAGGDEDFTDGDGVSWPITDVEWNEATYTATLTVDPPCAYLPRDLYRVVVNDTLQTPCGLHLDGDFPAGGTATDLPSGDGQPGGDFVAEFEILNAPPLAHHGFTTATQGAEIPLQPLNGCDADGDALTFSIVTPPQHGTLQAGTDSAHWIYEPDDPTVVQDDGFEFRAFDNHDAESDVAYSPSQRYDILMTADACDLEPTSLVVDGPDNVHLGDTITVSWTGINNGPGTTVDHGDVDWRETFYLSETPDLSGDYIEISQMPVNRSPLASEETYEESGRSLLLPDHVEWSGAYYLVLEVNSRASDQVESDRSNNVVATAVELDPYIELLTMCDAPLPVAEMTTLYDGQFVDTGSPLTFAWKDVDQQHSATVDLYIDDGAGQRWPIATGIGEDPEDAGDTVTASLPVDVPPRLAHYDVYAELVSPAGTFRSNAVPVRVFDRAYVNLDPLDDPVGGTEYQVYGIEAGVLDGHIYYRVRTDYNPGSNGSGDIYINVGGSWEDRYQDADGTWQDGSGTAHGIAVVDHASSRADDVHAGDLYAGSTFSPGSVVPPCPYRITDWTRHHGGVSSATVTSPEDVCWDYDLSGHFDPTPLGGTDQPVEIAWTMYCGNDIAAVTVPAARVAARYVFYNNSVFDGRNDSANTDDDNAIDLGKQALLPGETASFANYTSYSRGINGMMIDIAKLAGMPSADDFVFKVGNSRDSSGWGIGPDPTNITVRPDDGVAGSFRVTLIWPDHAIEKEWLQVTVLSDANGGSLGLAEDDVFYVGNAIGETGDSPFDAMVDQHDVEIIEAHTTESAELTNPYDIDRDGHVDEGDAALASDHMTTPETRLVLLGQAPPPVVTGVYAASTGWEPEFRDWLHSEGMADAEGYYQLPTDADQLHALPWSGLSQVRLAFSEEVTVEPSDLTLIGTNAEEVRASAFVYDAETCTGTWTFDALEADKYRLMLSDTVTATGSGLPLDGDYTDRDGQTASGDTVPGGDFSFRFNVLPGDATHSGNVVAADVSVLASAFGSFSSGSGGRYSAFVDFDGSGNVVAADVSILASHFGQFLPSGEPVVPDSDEAAANGAGITCVSDMAEGSPTPTTGAFDQVTSAEVGSGEHFIQQNPTAPADVSDDGYVSPLDALLLIRYLNDPGSAGAAASSATSTRYFDVNGDGYVSPADVLRVIAHLNSDGSGHVDGEGETAASTGLSRPRRADEFPQGHTPPPPVVPLSTAAVVHSLSIHRAAADQLHDDTTERVFSTIGHETPKAQNSTKMPELLDGTRGRTLELELAASSMLSHRPGQSNRRDGETAADRYFEKLGEDDEPGIIDGDLLKALV